MTAALPEERRNSDAAFEVLDLIYDYYDENGDLDIDCGDDDDDEPDIDGMVAYIARFMKKNSEVAFTAEELAAMVRAEIEYENSLF